MFGIFYVRDSAKEKDCILGTSEGKPIWLDSLEETISFISTHKIEVTSRTVIRDILGDFIVHEYDARFIRERLSQIKAI